MLDVTPKSPERMRVTARDVHRSPAPLLPEVRERRNRQRTDELHGVVEMRIECCCRDDRRPRCGNLASARV